MSFSASFPIFASSSPSGSTVYRIAVTPSDFARSCEGSVKVEIKRSPLFKSAQERSRVSRSAGRVGKAILLHGGIFARPDLEVDRIDAGCPNGNQDLTGVGT
ncbi:hypothetical protein [Bradyrhizobium sp. S3.2.12]|uniref:hypothetical protein n=1 Tax=Bradyrhizobium sp. S3.2.12 TaxID=3156387 RepID=UPI003398E069